MRVRFTTDRGRVTMFRVQLEVRLEGREWPVVCYDSAHGRPHCDTLDWAGRVVAKEWLPEELSLNEAFTFAERDLVANWRSYRVDFLRRKP